MSDNKKKEDGRDDSKIDGHDPAEVAYAAKELNATSQKIKDAIAIVGNSRKEVEAYIKGK